MPKLTPQDRHESQRGYFAYELYNRMESDPLIYLITGDLGFGMLDKIQRDFPDRVINTGAAEQAAVGIAIGLALSGKKPFVYSITPFLLYRAYEWLRNYVSYEEVPVRLIGSGRDKDYEHDGLTHWAHDAKSVIDTLPNINSFYPETKEEVPHWVEWAVKNEKPVFISLKR